MNVSGAGVVYSLCLLMSALCAGLLVRSYLRSRQPLLLWSACCFSLLALNNVLVVVDMVVIGDANLAWARSATALLAVSVLIYGFIWEVDR